MRVCHASGLVSSWDGVNGTWIGEWEGERGSVGGAGGETVHEKRG